MLFSVLGSVQSGSSSFTELAAKTTDILRHSSCSSLSRVEVKTEDAVTTQTTNIHTHLHIMTLYAWASERFFQ